MLYRDSTRFNHILELITAASQDYLKMQIDAGIDAIQIFDSWAGMFPRKILENFVLPSLKKLIDVVVDVPILVFARGSSSYVKEFLSLGTDGISFDAGRPLAEIRREVPCSVAVQGNLPSEFLYGSIEFIRRETQAHLASMTGDPGFIMNLGHGILPDIPVEHVQAFIETVVTN